MHLIQSILVCMAAISTSAVNGYGTRGIRSTLLATQVSSSSDPCLDNFTIFSGFGFGVTEAACRGDRLVTQNRLKPKKWGRRTTPASTASSVTRWVPRPGSAPYSLCGSSERRRS